MKNTKMLVILVLAMCSVVWSGQATSPGSIVGWGQNSDGQATPPAGSDFVAIAAGAEHSLALKSDGSIVGWGYNFDGQATPPASTDFVSIAAGIKHSLALKSDGSIVGWGENFYCQIPQGNDFVAIAARGFHSIALKSDGSIVGWGENFFGQASPPAGNDFVAIAAGYYHNLALKSDGSIVGWGRDNYGQASPPAGSNFVAIAAGFGHSLALKSDGSIVGWGQNTEGQASPPAGNDFVTIDVGATHSLALKYDDSIVCWGDNGQGQATTPEGNDFVAIAGGGAHSLAIKAAPSGGPENDNVWVVSGDNMYSILTGNVGIGTSHPREKLDVAGAANLNKGISAGIALRVNGAEALWYNGTYFSWGFGGTANFFADNVGIGTASPSEKLEVQGINPRILVDATSSNPELNLRAPGKITWAMYQDASTGDLRLYQAGDKITFQNSSGNVGIGQVDPRPHKLYVNGTGYATGGFWASDLRFKKNIKTIDSPIDKINNIRGVLFEWKRSEYQDKGFPEGEHYGVIAQEIEQVLPEIVKEGPDGDKAVSYTELVPILTEAIKEQQRQLDEQQRQVECLLQRVESLEVIMQQQQFAVPRQVQQ